MNWTWFDKGLFKKKNRHRQPSRRKRALLTESLEARQLLASMNLRFEYANQSGVVSNSLLVGENYTLRAYVQDLRGAGATGIRNAYFNIDYNNVIDVNGNAVPSADYPLDPGGDGLSSNTRISNAGGIIKDISPPIPANSELLLFSIPFQAIASGTLDLDVGQVSSVPRQPLFFSEIQPIPLSEISIANDTIQVLAAGVQLSRTSGLTTTEAGGSDTFTAVLTSQPTGNVSFTVSSSDTTEGNVSPQTISFSTSDWNIPKTITVTGVNDQIDDDDIAFQIITSATTSSDSRFNNLAVQDVSVTNQDDDTANFIFSTTSVVTSEAPGPNTATFTVRLASEPIANVTINLSSSDATEASVSPSSLLFTPANWNVNQTVTVTGQDDTLIDEPQNYTIITSVPITSDPKYAAINPPDVTGVNNDNDVLTEVQLNRTSGLVTTELGGTDTFTAVLSSPPTANVSFTVSSSNSAEGTVAPQTVTFTPSDWNVPKSITVTGVNDAIDDGDVAYSILTSATSSTDTRYNNLNVSDVSVVNQDDSDAAGFMVNPLSGLTTSENATGNTATFTVGLTSQPTAGVTINLSSSDTTEGTVAPTQLVFNASNWNVLQTVTVTGVNDDLVDGAIQYQIITAPAVSADLKYNELNPPDVSVTNTDNDVRSVIISRTSGLITTEAGGQDTFQIRLSHEPAANVTISLTSSRPSEGTVSPATLTFTSSNWNVNQTVTVTGVDDDGLDDDDQPLTIITGATVSTDTNFNGIEVPDVSVTNQDDDVTGISVTPTSGLVTTEAGAQATFGVVLRSRPANNVTINLSTLQTTEVSIDKASLTFTPANWQTMQVVTVTGLADDVVDGDQAFVIRTAAAISPDPRYNGIDPADVMGLNTDVNTAAVLLSTTSLETTEPDTTATVTVRLSARPAANVTINLSSSNLAEGTVSPATLTLTPTNWQTGVVATVTAVDDNVVDGPMTYSIITSSTTSSDQSFNGLTVSDLTVVNRDNDVAGIVVTPTTGLVTTESQGTATFQVQLRSQPAANVTIPIRSSDVSEGTLSVSSLVFTPANWNIAQTVTVTGQDDAIDDGNVIFSVITDPATSTDPNYSGLNTDDISLVNNDNGDLAGVTVLADANLTTSEEDAGTATFQVVLNSQPTADVIIAVSSSDVTEGTVDKSQLVFTAANWNIRQTVTITGVDDATADGDTVYSIQLAPATSSDPKYAGKDPDNLTVTNVDDDVPGFSVRPTTGLTTSETESTATFEIVLTQQPTSGVTVTLSSSDPSEGVLSVSSVTFTPANWDQPQVITVRGVADNQVDGNQSYQIITGQAQSDDPFFVGINPPDVRLINQDIDTATVSVVGPGAKLEGSTGVTDFVFEVELDRAVSGGFDLAFNTVDGTATAASGDYTANSGTLRFVGSAGEKQTVTVRINADTQVEADEAFQLVLGALTNIDAARSSRISLPTAPTSATILNDDTATVTLVATSNTTRDEGTGSASPSFTFTVTLSAAVQGGFTIPFATNDGTATVADNDYVDADQTLTFTGTAGEVKTITVQGVADARVEADETFTASLGTISGLGQIAASNVSASGSPITATLTNDDFPSLLLSDVTISKIEGSGTGTTLFEFSVTLTDHVFDTDGFKVPFTISDGTATVADGDYVANNGELSFVGTAGESHKISVLVNRDAKVENDETFTVNLGDLIGLAAAQTVLVPTKTLTATIQNDDSAQVTLTAIAASQQEGTGAGTTDYSFVVTLDRPVQGGFSLAYTTLDGTATVGNNDYVANSGSLTFAGTANESKTIVVQVNRDSRVEADETFQLSLGSLSGLLVPAASVTVTGSPLTATIQDDDTATLTLTGTTSQAEGNGTGTTAFTYEVRLTGEVAGGFSVPYTTSDGTATVAGSDYTDNDGTLQFAGTAGEVKTFTVLANRDNQVEGDETFVVALGTISGLGTGLDNGVITVGSPLTSTILNDDTATVTLSGPNTIVEGNGGGPNAVDYEVTLSAPVQGGFSLAYSINDGTATVAGNDYVDNDGILVFSGTANEKKTIRLQVNRDANVERDENLQIVLGQLTGIPAALTSSLQVTTTPLTVTIQNDEQATVEFDSATSAVLELDGQHTVNVRLSVPGGGAITEPLTVNVIASAGTATSADFTLSTQSLTFPAGSADGEVRAVQLAIANDGVIEEPETFSVRLEIASGNNSGLVTVGPTGSHQVTVSDDPLNAAISGVVWVDANSNGVRDTSELTLPGVTVRLQGTDMQGRMIDIVTMTDANGAYRFERLPGGTYSLLQTQPIAFHDGQAVAGTAGGSTSSNRVSGINLRPSQQSTGNNFSELGVTSKYIHHGMFLARPAQASTMRELVAVGSSDQGNASEAAMIRNGRGFEVRQVGSEVTITGSSSADKFVVTPASNRNGNGKHQVSINGMLREFSPDAVDSLIIDGGLGLDEIELRDTSGDDRLSRSQGNLLMTSSGLSIEAISFELARAISESGGTDRRESTAFDAALRLAGPWV